MRGSSLGLFGLHLGLRLVGARLLHLLALEVALDDGVCLDKIERLILVREHLALQREQLLVVAALFVHRAEQRAQLASAAEERARVARAQKVARVVRPPAPPMTADEAKRAAAAEGLTLRTADNQTGFVNVKKAGQHFQAQVKRAEGWTLDSRTVIALPDLFATFSKVFKMEMYLNGGGTQILFDKAKRKAAGRASSEGYRRFALEVSDIEEALREMAAGVAGPRMVYVEPSLGNRPGPPPGGHPAVRAAAARAAAAFAFSTCMSSSIRGFCSGAVAAADDPAPSRRSRGGEL